MDNMSSKHSLYIVEFLDQLAYLSSLQENRLQDWIERALNDNLLPLDIGREEPDSFLVDVYREANIDFKQRIRNAINELLHSYSKEFHLYSYLDSLIRLSGRFRIISNFTKIKNWAYTGMFYGCLIEGSAFPYNDIHLSCLKTIGPQAKIDDKELFEICIRDIEKNSFYFGICFRILLSCFTKREKYFMKYFPIFLEYCQSGDFFIENDLPTIFELMAPYNLIELSRNVVYRIEDTDNLWFLLKTCAKILMPEKPQIADEMIIQTFERGLMLKQIKKRARGDLFRECIISFAEHCLIHLTIKQDQTILKCSSKQMQDTDESILRLFA